MKTAKMTIRMQDGELAFAKRFAEEQGLSLTDLILRYIRRLSRPAAGGTPTEVRTVAGIVPARTNATAEHRKHLLGKHA